MRLQQEKVSTNLIWLCLLFGFLLVFPLICSRSQTAYASGAPVSQTFSNQVAAKNVGNAPTSAPLTYHFGPIQDSQNIYAIFWLPSGDHFEQQPGGNDSHFESIVSRYFHDVGGSNLSRLLVQYPDNLNASPTTRVSFGGAFVDTTPYPHAGSTADPLLGQDITNEIQKIISSGSLPTGISTVYYLFTANGINICQDQLKEICSIPTTQQPNGFCAFHSYFQPSAIEPYVAVPVNPSGIPGGCELTLGILHSSAFPNSDQFADSAINIISQEQVDVQTDPLGSAWYDTDSAQEISSKCTGQYGTVNATDGHNVVMNGNKYIIQQEWSNSVVACTLIPPVTSLVGIKFLPSGLSSPISPSNYFTITYAIGNQLFVFNYVGKPVSIDADTDTSVSIAPVSSKSSVLEKWCLNAACQGDVIPLSATPENVTLGYHDLLVQYVFEATSDSSSPTAFATLSYSTAPAAASSSTSPANTTVTLTGISQAIWAERGTLARVPTTPQNKSTTERWISPAGAWAINQASQIPITISYHQFLMNYNYTLAGGSATGSGPSITFVSEGVQQTSSLPKAIWCDAGSSYAFGQGLAGNTTTERWILTSGEGTGVVTMGSTVHVTYYHQYQVFLSYQIAANGTSISLPSFSATYFGTRISITVNHTAFAYWLDAGSIYTFTNPLPGSNISQRWISIQINHGTINSSLAKVLFYYHQYALYFSYSIVGGGAPPSVPYLNYSSLNGTSSLRLSGRSSPVWINAGSNFTVNSATAALNSTERWAFNSESEFATSAGSITITLYHQFEVGFNITIGGGGAPLSQPTANIVSFGKQLSLSTPDVSKIAWADAGTNYTILSSLGSTSNERWITIAPLTRIVNSPLRVIVVYHHQFLISLGYSTNGADPSGGPSVSLVSLGSTEQVPVNQTATSIWADAGTSYTFPPQLPGSGEGERWVSNSTLTAVINSSVSASPMYNHQYMVTVTTNPPGTPVLVTPTSGWVNAGANVELSATGGRTWHFEGWQGVGQASFTGNQSDTFITVTSPVTETGTVYAALTVSAVGTGSISYSFGNVTGTVPQGQTKVIFVPPDQPLNVNANPFPVFYTFSEWNGSMTQVGNSSGTSQNPYTFSITTPSAITGFFKINLTGVLLVPIAVIVTVGAVFLVRRRGKAPAKEDEEEEESVDSDDEDLYAATGATK